MASVARHCIWDGWELRARRDGLPRPKVAAFWKWRAGPSAKYRRIPARLADLTAPAVWLAVCCRRRGWPPEEATDG